MNRPVHIYNNFYDDCATGSDVFSLKQIGLALLNLHNISSLLYSRLDVKVRSKKSVRFVSKVSSFACTVIIVVEPVGSENELHALTVIFPRMNFDVYQYVASERAAGTAPTFARRGIS